MTTNQTGTTQTESIRPNRSEPHTSKNHTNEQILHGAEPDKPGEPSRRTVQTIDYRTERTARIEFIRVYIDIYIYI